MSKEPRAPALEGELSETDGSELESQSGSAAYGLPRIDFATFVLSLSHSALVHLGDAPNPSNGAPDQNLPMAQQTVDLLSLLEQKTSGNLTGEEERVLQQVLYDLRLRYVEVSRGK